MARPVVDLPQPDSPTRPRVSPFLTENEMSSTAHLPLQDDALGDREVHLQMLYPQNLAVGGAVLRHLNRTGGCH
jgi:hypothetical protein